MQAEQIVHESAACARPNVSQVEISPVEATKVAKNWCDLIRNNVENLSDAECKLLLAMVDAGREIRVMTKAASRIWGGDFDGGTAEIVGPALYRQLLRRMERFDDVHRPAPSVESMGQINGYDVHFLKPDFVYRVQGNGLCRSFSPRYMPISGMDIEDVMNVLDIIAEHEA
ncbi:hypothetical protein [Rhizobium sp. MHM7A]|uniref:hypothetical protein n=1 Tax=Rhizobium sp. MHM7A TaxID=2583233 RepID=UPI001106E0D0|nr:hypothetical protein [Rhizobium sp. MHM7A]TLX16178.1 hypothetical protein FFR93_02300 [Rhizobium sp. MHM7A]